MDVPDIKEETARRYIELMEAIRSNIQDFLSDYKRDDDLEDWNSVSACTNAMMQVDMSVHGAIEWLEVNSGIKERPQPQHPWGGMPMPVDEHDEHDEQHGSYL